MRRSHAGPLAVALSLVGAAPAAADVEINALDSPAWAPANVNIAAGETVTWSFDGTLDMHNVASQGDNWSLSSPYGQPAARASFTFQAAGTYHFVCQVHSGMQGYVVVGDAAPPPPPPLSEQPFPSDMAPVDALETGGLDATKPSISALRLRHEGAGARVSLRVSERARVTLRLKRGAKVVRTRYARGAGRIRLSVGDTRLRAGRYRVEVSARDVAGNRSPVRRASITLR